MENRRKLNRKEGIISQQTNQTTNITQNTELLDNNNQQNQGQKQNKEQLVINDIYYKDEDFDDKIFQTLDNNSLHQNPFSRKKTQNQNQMQQSLQIKTNEGDGKNNLETFQDIQNSEEEDDDDNQIFYESIQFQNNKNQQKAQNNFENNNNTNLNMQQSSISYNSSKMSGSKATPNMQQRGSIQNRIKKNNKDQTAKQDVKEFNIQTNYNQNNQNLNINSIEDLENDEQPVKKNQETKYQLQLPQTPNKSNITNVYQNSLITFLEDEENSNLKQIPTSLKQNNKNIKQLENIDIPTPVSQRYSQRRRVSSQYSQNLSQNQYGDEISEFSNEIISKNGLNIQNRDKKIQINNLDIDNLKEFINQPLKKDICLLCQIKKKGKLLSTYEFSMNKGQQILMTAEQKFSHKNSEYIIYIQESQFSKDKIVVGRIKGNFFGSEYVVFDDGDNPQNQLKNISTVTNTQLQQNLKKLCRKNLAAIMYQTVDSIRQLNVVLPSIDEQIQQPIDYIPLDEKELLINKLVNFTKQKEKITKVSKNMNKQQQQQQYELSLNDVLRQLEKENFKNLDIYENRMPVYNEDTQQLELDFTDRVEETSTKNFQLVKNQQSANFSMQLGKQSQNIFNLDFCWPLTPLQAFCIGVSSFDKKWE